MAKYSGISYVIEDNGTNTQLASKISTINGCNYDLVDAHRVGWNNSYLLYANKDSLKEKYMNEFFQKEGSDNNYKYLRYEGSDFEKKYPTWFDTGYFNHTSELLDMNDYLCYITTYAMGCIEYIFNALNNDKTILKLNPTQIENLGGSIDQITGDVRNNPIRFEFKPNQNNINFVGSTYFFSTIESRSLKFDLRVYSIDGTPLSDPNIFWSDPNDPNKVSKLEIANIESIQTEPIKRITENVRLTESLTNPNVAGYFEIELELVGWKPLLNYRCDKIRINDASYKTDNYKRIEFIAALASSANYQRSPNRQVSMIVSKAENNFDYIFINNDKYVFIPEYFFIHKNEESDDLLLAKDEFKKYLEYHKTNNSELASYIIRASAVPSEDMVDKLTREYINSNDLYNELIPVGIYSTNEKYRKALNLAANANINIEVYPKYFGNSNYINGGKMPSGYDANEETNLYNSKLNFSNQFDSNVKNGDTLGFYMIPLFCMNISTDKYSSAISTSIDTNTYKYVGSNNNSLCVECEREINNIKRAGFKFSFRINCNEDIVRDISTANKDLNNQTGYVDLYFGTTSTKFVGTNVMKIRLQLQALHAIYIIDYNRDTSGIEVAPSANAIKNQISMPITNKVLNILSNKDNFELIASSVTPKDISSPNTEYIWNLEIPIFSIFSWNDTSTPSANYEEIRSTIIMPTTLVDVKTNSNKNSLEKPNNRYQLPEKFFGTNYKPNSGNDYNNGFPKLLLRYDDEMDIKNHALISARTYYLDSSGTGKYYNPMGEIEIDYAATWNANKDGFVKKLSNNGIYRSIKNEIFENADLTDKQRGERLCRYFVGIVQENGAKYLMFIRPTIPSESYYGKHTDFNLNEWEDVITNDNRGFKLVLVIPEKAAGTSSGQTHYSSKITVNLNVHRATKEYSGWARRAKESSKYTAEDIVLEYATQIRYDSLISTGSFEQNNSFNVLTRNMNNIKLYSNNKVNDNPLIYKYDISSLDGITSTVYAKVKDTLFEFYASKEEALNQTNTSPKIDAVYVIDKPLSFKLLFNNDGNEWFKGYYGGSNTRDIDVSIFRKKMSNQLSIKDNFTNNSQYFLSYKNTSKVMHLPQMLRQFITDGNYKCGESLQSSQKQFGYIKLEHLRDFKLNVFNFFNENDSTFAELTTMYGNDYVEDFLRVSVTGGCYVDGNINGYPEQYIKCTNGDNLNSNSMSMFLDANGNINDNSPNGYNKYYYNGNSVKNINSILKIENEDGNKIIHFNADIGSLGTASFNDGIAINSTLGLYIAIMLPMTNKYKGQLFVIKLDLKIIA